MKIPAKIKIGGLTFDVKQVAEIPGREEKEFSAIINFDDCEIFINKNINEQYKEVLLLHEIIHGVCAYSGLKEEEEFVERLAYGLHQALKDNNLTF
jgi:hypothetical protein